MSSPLDFIRIKNNIDNLKIEKAKKEGTLENLLKELQEKHKIKNPKMVSKSLEDLKTEIEMIDSTIKQKTQEFMSKYPGLI